MLAIAYQKRPNVLSKPSVSPVTYPHLLAVGALFIGFVAAYALFVGSAAAWIHTRTLDEMRRHESPILVVS